MSGRRPNAQNRGKGGKGGGQRANNNKIYAHPLPLVFSPVESPSQRLLALLGLSSGVQVLNPHCTGFFDRDTKSVWVTDSADAQKLWRRGFFGKGNLSRSEPSWLARQINARKLAGKGQYNIPLIPRHTIRDTLLTSYSFRYDIGASDGQTPRRAPAVQD
jgi:hypothetical protein